MVFNLGSKAITTVIQDFTGVYAEQPFMQELRELAKTNRDIHWLDCTKIVGTDCYCDDEAIKVINELIDSSVHGSSKNARSIPEIHFFDNGNYHYMSKLWTDRVQEPFTLVVFDHHPDMQPPRFGGILSCGGWVKEVLDNNKFIQNAIIIGIKDELVKTVREELSQLGEASILDKVTFITENEIKATPEGQNPNRVHFTSLITHSTPIYISIDKDALAPAFAATNWDQGSLSTESLKKIIADLASSNKILGIDICGERSPDFEGNEFHTVQEADSLNNKLNQELVEFFKEIYFS